VHSHFVGRCLINQIVVTEMRRERERDRERISSLVKSQTSCIDDENIHKEEKPHVGYPSQ